MATGRKSSAAKKVKVSPANSADEMQAATLLTTLADDAEVNITALPAALHLVPGRLYTVTVKTARLLIAKGYAKL